MDVRQSKLIEAYEQKKAYNRERHRKIKEEREAAENERADLERRQAICAAYVAEFPECAGYPSDDLWTWANEICANGKTWVENYEGEEGAVVTALPVADKPRKLTLEERKTEKEKMKYWWREVWWRGMYARELIADKGFGTEEAEKKASAVITSVLNTSLCLFRDWLMRRGIALTDMADVDSDTQLEYYREWALSGGGSFEHWIDHYEKYFGGIPKVQNRGAVDYDEQTEALNAEIPVIEPE